MIVARAQEVESPKSPPPQPFAPKDPGKEIDLKEDRYLLRPDSTLRLAWDVVTTVLILAQAVFIPLYVAFAIPLSTGLEGAEMGVTFTLLANVLVEFNTGYYHNGSLVYQRRKIAINYAKTSLWFDLLVFLPFDFLAFPQDLNREGVEYWSIGHLSLLPRLFALLKIPTLLKSLENLISTSFTANLLTLTRKIVAILLIGHFIACYWFITAEIQGSWTHLTWTITLRREKGYEPSWGEFYITAVYWTYSVLLTVGFGDIVPKTTAEKMYATLCMLLSCGVFAFMLGSIGTLVAKRSALDEKYKDLTISMNAFMSGKQFPQALRERVRLFLHAVQGHSESNPLSDQKLFQLLSAPLREEVSAYVHGAAVTACRLFRGLSRQAIALTGRCMKDEIFAQGELLFAEGSCRTKLYYIESGQVEIVHMRTNTLLRTLHDGEYFGQIGFFLRKPRCASAHCLGFVNVLTLERDQLSEGSEKSEELEAVLLGIESKCVDGDLSALYLRCYLCRALGHVALACKKEVVNAGGDIIRTQWLARRQKSRSINLSVCQPNFERKPRRIRHHDNSPQAVSLQKKIATFSTLSQATQSIRVVAPPERPSLQSARPDWNNYFDSESEEPSDLLSYCSA